MESWRLVWRKGFAPVLSDGGLAALLRGLETDDPRIVQGCTTTPPPLFCVSDWNVEACCALGFCGWQGDGLTTVGEVEEYFAKCCFEADQQVGEPAACRWFLNWFDDTPRHEMRSALTIEVKRELALRELRWHFPPGDGGEAKMNDWLNTPNPGFFGKSPAEVLNGSDHFLMDACLAGLRGDIHS
jgi:hypothetical protein